MRRLSYASAAQKAKTAAIAIAILCRRSYCTEIVASSPPGLCYAPTVSVIIYGVRPYGTVEAHGGEHAETHFFHIWFVPLIPTSSHWITQRTHEGSRGYSIDMHAKSVLAGYLRVWGP